MSTRVKLSLWPGLQQPWSEVLALVEHAEATGWDGVYLADHFMGSGSDFGAVDTPTLECTAGLAALAAATSRVRLGPLVLGMTYRHPAVLAKWAATVDHVSGGRLTLGVGTGWQENEHEQYGLPMGTPGERVARFTEAVAVLRGMLSTSPTTTVEGRYFRVVDAVAEPKPVQEPLPILIGGKGDRMLGIVARHADEWNLWSMPALQADRFAVLARHCEAIGRDPSTIHRSTQALVRVTDDEASAARFVEGAAPRAAVAGPPERFAEYVAAQGDLGVDEIIVPDIALGTGQRRLDTIDALLEAVRSS